MRDPLKIFRDQKAKERKEHPWAPNWVLTKLVQDHMKKMR